MPLTVWFANYWRPQVSVSVAWSGGESPALFRPNMEATLVPLVIPDASAPPPGTVCRAMARWRDWQGFAQSRASDGSFTTPAAGAVPQPVLCTLWQPIPTWFIQDLPVTAAPPSLPADGTRIRNSTNGAIYMMLDRQLRHVTDPTMYVGLYGNNNDNWTSVTSVEGYPVGAALTPETATATAPGNPAIYLLVDRTKRWISSAETFNRFGFSWNTVVRMDPAQLAAIPDGPAIS
jgi:hypothetical protein